MVDAIARCLLSEPPLRVVAAVTTGVAREAGRRHRTVGGAQVALARGATCGLLLATLTKGGEKVNLQILGNGPCGRLLVDANDAGDVRAYLKHPHVLIPGPSGQRVDIGAGMGHRGLVSVVRDLGLRQRFTGQAPMVSGEIDTDVEHYLRISEQIDSALGCEVLLANSELAASAGVLVQCMPDGEATGLVQETRECLRSGVLLRLLAAGVAEPAALARGVLDGCARDRAGDDLEVLDTRPVRYHCPCSQERVLAAVALVSAQDLDAMIDEDGGAEVSCDFCGAVYKVALAELEQMRAARLGRAST